MDIDLCTTSDLDEIRSDIVDFWGSERTLHLHHAVFLHEFGDTAFVIRRQGRVAAYLMGFVSQTGPVGYIHIVAVRSRYRGQGLARRLYEHFAGCVRARGCTTLKADTIPENAASIAFHKALGFELQGSPNTEGVPVVKDYAGRGRDMVVFRKQIPPEG